MTKNNQIRLEIANRFKNYFTKYNEVKSIIISGSTSINKADEFSDLELGIFWESKPDINLRNKIIEEIKPNKIIRQTEFEDDSGWMGVDNIEANSFCIDIAHNTFESFEKLVNKVIDQVNLDLVKQKKMFVLANSKIIYGEEYLKSLKEKADYYPDNYQEAMLIKYSNLPSLSKIILDVLREDKYRYFKSINELIEKIYFLLLALNKVYFPSDKRVLQHILDLEIKPKDIDIKLKSLYELDLKVGYKLIENIVGDLFELIFLINRNEELYKNYEKFKSTGRYLWDYDNLSKWPEAVNYKKLEEIIKPTSIPTGLSKEEIENI